MVLHYHLLLLILIWEYVCNDCNECSSLFREMMVSAKDKFNHFFSASPRGSNLGLFDFMEPVLTCELEDRDRIGDGPKWICGLKLLKHDHCCIVYSIGSCGEYSFKSAVRKVAPNCEIHIYDHTVSRLQVRIAWDKYNSTLHLIGLGQETKGKLMTLEDMMKANHHFGSPINIFKVDVEGAEYESFVPIFDMLQSGHLHIDQILIEMHQTTTDLHAYLRKFKDSRFLMSHKERNGWGCRGVSCVEFAFLSYQWYQVVFHTTHCPSCPPLFSSAPTFHEIFA